MGDATFRPFGTLQSAAGAGPTAQRFPGQLAEADTGLSYNDHRDYDTSLGRYIEPDPIGLMGGLNRYAYVGGNPVGRVDPKGQAGQAILLGMVSGALSFAALEAGEQLASNGGRFQCLDRNRILIAGLIGGAFGAIGGLAAESRGLAALVRTLGRAERIASETAEGAGAAAGTGTVWDAITATQEFYQGTVIPRSFRLATEGADVWVAPNATEHLAEYALANLARGVGGDLVNVGTQAQLASLQAAVGAATAKGVTYGIMLNEAGWELMFATARIAGRLPALVHAFPY